MGFVANESIKIIFIKKKHPPSLRYSRPKLVSRGVDINNYYIMWSLTEPIIKFRIQNKMIDYQTYSFSVENRYTQFDSLPFCFKREI